LGVGDETAFSASGFLVDEVPVSWFLVNYCLCLTGDFMILSGLCSLTFFSKANLDFSMYISNSSENISEISIFY